MYYVVPKSNIDHGRRTHLE